VVAISKMETRRSSSSRGTSFDPDARTARCFAKMDRRHLDSRHPRSRLCRGRGGLVRPEPRSALLRLRSVRSHETLRAPVALPGLRQDSRVVMASSPDLITGSPNPTLQPTATSHRLCHMISGYSITPSRLLLPHPARRRSTSELADVFSRVAVAELFR
jgi:hypothetical protein